MTLINRPQSTDLYSLVLRLVAEQGFDDLTMDLIALESGRSKPALYGQWGGKVGIVVAAVSHHHGLDEQLPNTGTLLGDLAALQARQGLTGSDPALTTAMIHAMNAPIIIDPIVGSPGSNASHVSAFHENVLLPALGIT